MIKPLMANSIAKKALLGTMLMGATVVGAKAATGTKTAPAPNYTEISKEASSAISSNAVAAISPQGLAQTTPERNDFLENCLKYKHSFFKNDLKTTYDKIYKNLGGSASTVVLQGVEFQFSTLHAANNLLNKLINSDKLDSNTKTKCKELRDYLTEKLSNGKLSTKDLKSVTDVNLARQNGKASYATVNKALDAAIVKKVTENGLTLENVKPLIDKFDESNGCSTTTNQKLALLAYKTCIYNILSWHTIWNEAVEAVNAESAMSSKVLTTMCDAVLTNIAAPVPYDADLNNKLAKELNTQNNDDSTVDIPNELDKTIYLNLLKPYM